MVGVLAVRLYKVIEMLLARDDHVIFDAPPVTGLTDGPLLTRGAESCLFVIEPGRSPVRGIWAAMQRLRMVGGPIFGAIVTKIDINRQHYGYGYGYGNNIKGSEGSAAA